MKSKNDTIVTASHNDDRRYLQGTLLEVLDRLDDYNDADRYSAAVIYAEAGVDSAPDSQCIVCPCNDDDSFACPLNPDLYEVLMLQLAKNAIEVWSLWRENQQPTSLDKFEAVMFYAQNDTYLPVNS